MTAQFRRALERRNVMGAEMAMREMGVVSLDEALDYLAVLAELHPERAALASSDIARAGVPPPCLFGQRSTRHASWLR